MDNGTAERLIETNRRLIEAMGMHWANEQQKINNKTLLYTDADFSNLAWKSF